MNETEILAAIAATLHPAAVFLGSVGAFIAISLGLLAIQWAVAWVHDEEIGSHQWFMIWLMKFYGYEPDDGYYRRTKSGSTELSDGAGYYIATALAIGILNLCLVHAITFFFFAVGVGGFMFLSRFVVRHNRLLQAHINDDKRHNSV